MACIRYFESKFPNQTYESVGIHPNNYYESANKILNPSSYKNNNYAGKYSGKKDGNISYEQPQEG